MINKPLIGGGYKMKLTVPFILAGALAGGCTQSQPAAVSEKTVVEQPPEQTSVKVTGKYELTVPYKNGDGSTATREFVTFDHPSNPDYSCLLPVKTNDNLVYGEVTPVCVPKPAR
jgi:hypothetical protein